MNAGYTGPWILTIIRDLYRPLDTKTSKDIRNSDPKWMERDSDE